MQDIFETENFIVQIPDMPFVSREEGGHVRIQSKLQVTDRTKLNPSQAKEYTRLSIMLGEALKNVMSQSGIDIGIVNYQEMGNWSVFKPEGPILHMHVFGRAKNAVKQKYGEAVQLPRRETGFYEGFTPLNKDEIFGLKRELEKLNNSDRFINF